MTGEAKRPNFSSELDRRKFIGVAAATAGAILIRPKLVRGTAANSAIRVGLLGCGGRVQPCRHGKRARGCAG